VYCWWERSKRFAAGDYWWWCWDFWMIEKLLLFFGFFWSFWKIPFYVFVVMVSGCLRIFLKVIYYFFYWGYFCLLSVLPVHLMFFFVFVLVFVGFDYVVCFGFCWIRLCGLFCDWCMILLEKLCLCIGKDGNLVMENLFKFMSCVKIYSLFTHFLYLFWWVLFEL